ncbi:2-dehydro-3-deoxygalactonokinase [Aliiroseovarius sp. M344]|nr:2-dehydro-3-deoxygalactonokinase [Aliiroseovarius sp. M344]UWQ14264.1 2-dehydro-3-deoxygalactonokinase [Aliiroseovarius sp. M344]
MDLGAKPDWIAVDWGTTHLRVWLMSAAGKVLERRESDKGMGGLARDAFEPTLHALLQDKLTDTPLPVLVCGMAGSRQGWAEAPYVAVPCAPPGVADATHLSVPAMEVFILPGVKQSSPADVMRGEETQIAGFLSGEPDYDGVLCLPGTHNKWVHISAGEIVSFRTFMTGELFDLISTRSVLRHSVNTDGWDQSAFDAALADTMSRPADLAAKLFSLRAEGLLENLSAEAARTRLSALLIGAELAAAKPYWLGQQVVILGEDTVARAYETALAAQGAAVRVVEAENATLAGLVAAYNSLKKALA